ncbi:MAG TPA: hypothetical protein VLK79_02695 [Gaiellales bacterium]|nr:hypothetical protein [Gaiellales bacterium]
MPGRARSKSGAATLQDYDEGLASDLLPALGGTKLNDVHQADVLRLVERVQRRGAGGAEPEGC